MSRTIDAPAQSADFAPSGGQLHDKELMIIADAGHGAGTDDPGGG